ncbi:ABC transporter ATP-binding protein [Streptomyces sp. RTd22]|uniref:ABC transporter ATP-binding protein n=1 Tax=Streptomyces sp. RTd22 TaxID=1841249 RepID=UPI0007C4E722|nr:ABC transporter ATP-binding protein [Streptomyces sp. RTd22]
MSHVSVSGLTRRFDGNPPTVAVADLDLEIEDGEFLVLLGPSGCGKTTTLRCLAGLESPGAGTIRLGDATVFDHTRKLDLPPNRRFIGMVFQSYALWPHMTVRENIGYPLKARKMKEALASGRVEETAALVDCQDLLGRYPAQLSGGQQQRVALARGLVARPDLVLFDEPLSNLDARLRDQVRAELHELHQRKPFTAVFVTHDQSEALALGDRMAIMRSGAIEQLGSPRDVFEDPATEYVAAFTGMSNRIVAHFADGVWKSGTSEMAGAMLRPSHATGDTVVRVRPDDARLATGTDALAPHEAGLPAVVADVEYGGRHLDVTVEADGGLRLNVRADIRRSDDFLGVLGRGDQVVFAFDTEAARYFDTTEGARRSAEPASVGVIA